MRNTRNFRAIRCEHCLVVLHRGDTIVQCDCPVERYVTLSPFGHVFAGERGSWSGITEE